MEQVELGESTPRTICSGIKEFYPDPKAIEGKLVLVISNLKPRNMGTIASNGLVLAASVPSTDGGKKEKVELVEAPEGSKPGERVSF